MNVNDHLKAIRNCRAVILAARQRIWDREIKLAGANAASSEDCDLAEIEAELAMIALAEADIALLKQP